MGKPTGRICGAIKKDGSVCRNPAGTRTDHVGYGKCAFHFGATPMVTLSAIKAEALDLARSRLGMYLDVDPGQALLALIAEAASNVAFYRQRLDLLDQLGDEVDTAPPGAPVRPRGEHYGDLYVRLYHKDGTPTGDARPHVLVVLYNQERDRLASLCEKALALGLREREVRIAEQQADVIVGAIRAILDELSLTADQQQLVPTVVRRQMLALLPGAG